MRRNPIILIVVALLAGVSAVAWVAAGLPPAKLVLSYGFPPTGGPTGRKVTIEGVTFVELSPCYSRIGSHFLCEKGDLLGWFGSIFHLSWGKQPKHASDCPVRWVEIPRAFWMAETEITNAQYERYDPQHERRGYSDGDRDPVTDVSWDEARAYCDWLSTRGGLAVRLPSEAEWESACRAGSRTEYCFGDDEAGLGEYAVFDRDWEDGTAEVGTRRPNPWGLYDLHGNAWEWVEDTYHADYKGAPTDGSAWTEGGEEWSRGTPGRVFRGGSWFDPAGYCRSARRWFVPARRDWDLGFRPAASGSP